MHVAAASDVVAAAVVDIVAGSGHMGLSSGKQEIRGQLNVR